jgi:hypothetical protein
LREPQARPRSGEVDGVKARDERPDTDRGRWRERVESVFAFLEETILALPVHQDHQQLLRIHLEVGKERAEAWPRMSSVQLPLLVHAAITGEERPAVPVAGACTFLYLGADLFDSVVDHELPPPWHDRDSSQAILAATTLLGALPELSIARLQENGMPAAQLWALAHLFAKTGLKMGAGQHEDLLFSGLENVSIEDCRRMAERKSGQEYALFTTAGATLATEDPPTIEAYASFGSCFGTAQQLINDAQDLWGEQGGRDLSNGKRTFPIVHALSTLRGSDWKSCSRPPV